MSLSPEASQVFFWVGLTCSILGGLFSLKVLVAYCAGYVWDKYEARRVQKNQVKAIKDEEFEALRWFLMRKANELNLPVSENVSLYFWISDKLDEYRKQRK